jgi:amino acid transporter
MAGLSKLASSGVIIGTLIPSALLVIMGIVFLGQGNTSAAPMDSSHVLPPWVGIASIVLIVNNFLSYSGMEMNAVHVSSLRKPGKEFPRAMTLASILVVLIFIFPALAISWVIPSQQLSLTAGVMQAFDAFFAHFGVPALTPVLGVMLLCASLSGFLTWLAGPSKGLLMIGQKEGYLPPSMQKVNKNGIQRNILVAQGVVTTLIGLLYAFLPAVSQAYWIFSVMTTQVYLIMYLLLFLSAARLRKLRPEVQRGYRAPALVLQCVVGFVASLAAIVIGFIPPSQFGSGNAIQYVALIFGGVAVFGLLVPGALLLFRKPGWKSDVPVEEVAG